MQLQTARYRMHTYILTSSILSAILRHRNLPDFTITDESGNALLIKWLAIEQARFGPQDGSKFTQNE